MATDMALGPSAPSSISDLEEPKAPMFSVQTVQMQFDIASDFVAAQVANGVLILALYSGRILRIDLDSPKDIDDIDLPKKVAETGIIRRLFIDPTASHLIISTTLNENYYLHSQSRQPKVLARLKGVPIEAIAWNPSQPTASTRAILVGASDGNLYETYIEPSAEFYKRDEKYLKALYKASGPISGIWAGAAAGPQSDLRTVLLAVGSRNPSSRELLLNFTGKIGRHGSEGSGSIFQKLFESTNPTVREAGNHGDAQMASPARSRSGGNHGSSLTMTPEAPDLSSLSDQSKPDRIFAWRSSEGIYHGRLGAGLTTEAQLLPRFPSKHDPTGLVALTQWHILQIIDGRLIASNRLDHSTVYDVDILEAGHKPIALMADIKRNEYWIFTTKSILEIKVEDEDRDIWKIMLKAEKFEEALQYANSASEKDAVATASGDFLIKKGQFSEAASVYGKSTKPFEQVALLFIDQGERDALRKYLTVKLSTLKKTAIMQRVLVASWLTEILMAKLNSLDDMMTTNAELVKDKSTSTVESNLTEVRREFQEFISKYKSDLDHKTTYEIISSHGRERELLEYASAINDYNYILSYWVQRENYSSALNALKKQSDPQVVYKYSSVLMSHVPREFVDILMRQSNIEARNLIPALLNYNDVVKVPLDQNQAVRYLRYEIEHRGSGSAAVHNTLISIYASNPSKDEIALLAYLETQSSSTAQSRNPTEALQKLPYDADFALRLCLQHSRIRSCVHIYSSMGQYLSAIELSLEHGETELAMTVAGRPEYDAALRKKLWLTIAKQIIAQSATTSTSKSNDKDHDQRAATKAALGLLRRAPPSTLRIEDLLPLFPDVTIIDPFKTEICGALDSYSASIDSLRAEMDSSAATAARIGDEVQRLHQRWVLVEPGEACSLCSLPLLERRFWVFGCAHGFHTDCLINAVIERGGGGGGGFSKGSMEGQAGGGVKGKSSGGRLKELTETLERAEVQGTRREAVAREVEEIIGRECVLCGSLAVRMVDQPFLKEAELARAKLEWAL